MDTMTPDQLFLIIGATACVIVVLCADQWWPFVKAFGSRYFVRRVSYVDSYDGSHAPIPAPRPTGTTVPKWPEPASELGSAEYQEPDRDDTDNLTEDDQALTWEDVARELASIEMLDSVTGKAAPLSVKRIAALVGKRHEDVAVIVREVREPIPGERVLRVKDAKGERAISWET